MNLIVYSVSFEEGRRDDIFVLNLKKKRRKKVFVFDVLL